MKFQGSNPSVLEKDHAAIYTGDRKAVYDGLKDEVVL